MEDLMTFRRFELKYLMTYRQQALLLQKLQNRIEPDSYAHSSVRNIYYDTDNFRLIRESLERPMYKEKLRVRSYGKVGDDDGVFVELKKKYDGVVYKRRICMPRQEAELALAGTSLLPDSQIGHEIARAISYYKTLSPKVYLSYERDSFRGITDASVRLTFDDQIRYRTEKLTLDSDTSGISLLEENTVLMEIKIPEALPFWLARCLSELNIRRIRFSKYGNAYQRMLTGKDAAGKNLIVLHGKGENKYA